MAQNADFHKEFLIYKQHQDQINIKFVRDSIQAKISLQKDAGDVQVTNERKESFDRHGGKTKGDLMLIKVISDLNIDAVLEGRACLSFDCLVR